MLFEPTSQNLKAEYPELDAIEEFSQLTQNEMLFVWFMENPDSPLKNTKPFGAKVDACIGKSYKLRGEGSLSVKDIERLQSGQFPDEISRALDRMKRFSPERRKQAKQMVDKVFEKFQNIINTPPTDLLIDTTVQKNYIDNAIKITDALPVLIQRIEEGFGYKSRQKKGETTGQSLMDRAGQHESDD
jgi:hypothetical protein